jgi:hypothetical protein
VARHLLLPRLEGAKPIAVERLNADDGQGQRQAVRGRQSGERQEYLQTVDSAVVDIGASNVEDLMALMRGYQGSHDDFDAFVVPTVPAPMQQQDTLATLVELARPGVPAHRLRLVCNMCGARARCVLCGAGSGHDPRRRGVAGARIVNRPASTRETLIAEALCDTLRLVDRVEDAPTGQRIGPSDRADLLTADPLLNGPPGLGDPEPVLDRDTVEALLQRLAAQAFGAPATVDRLARARHRRCATHPARVHACHGPRARRRKPRLIRDGARAQVA